MMLLGQQSDDQVVANRSSSNDRFIELSQRPSTESGLSELLLLLLRTVVAAADANRSLVPPSPPPKDDTSPTSSRFISPFWSSELPAISLYDYAKRLLRFSGYGEMGLIMGTVLLARYCAAVATRPDDAPLAPLTVHRLLLAAVLVGFKANEDRFYQNVYLARVGGVSLWDVNELEVAFLTTLNYAVIVSADDIRQLCSSCERAAAAAAATSTDISNACLMALRDCGARCAESWMLPSLQPHSRRSLRIAPAP